MMKLILLLLSVATGISAITPQDIGKLRIPGEKVSGQCAKYAYCLNFYLFQHGIESKAVAYKWDKAEQGHAVVLFKLDGVWYGIDNESDVALPLFGTTELEAIQLRFNKAAYYIQTGPAQSYYLSSKVRGYLKELKKNKLTLN